MPNNIELATNFIPYLDEVYRVASRTAILDAPSELAQGTANAGEVRIARILMDGAADYSRANGYVKGNVTLTWDPYKLTHDRGRAFIVDDMDDEESMRLVTMRLLSEFLRTQVVPEVDAIRLAQYYAKVPAANRVTGTLTKDTIVQAVADGIANLGENEVDQEGLVIFMTPTNINILESAINRSIPNAVGSVDNRIRDYNGNILISTPTPRFNTAITLNDGTTAGQEAGGYVTAGQSQNFLIVDRKAVVQVTKHEKIREFSPDVYQDANAWKLDYRVYHDAWVLTNKVNGLYSHAKAA